MYSGDGFGRLDSERVVDRVPDSLPFDFDTEFAAPDGRRFAFASILEFGCSLDPRATPEPGCRPAVTATPRRLPGTVSNSIASGARGICDVRK